MYNNNSENYDIPMSGAEIANELGISRQAVSNTLKRAMKKIYLGVQKIEENWTPFQIASSMIEAFNITNQEEINKFYRLFPPEIKELIEEDAQKGRGKR